MLDSRKIAIIFACLALVVTRYYSSHAEPCEQCKGFQSELAQEQKLLESYQQLKAKNVAYLAKTGIPAGAVIKVNSNILVITLKLETTANKIEALQMEKKKANCNQCKLEG